MVKPRDQSLRILIVDDEPTLVFFLRQGLKASDMTCTVDNASSGEEALSKLTLNKYDLLVTDLKMPGITGLTLIEVARSLQPHIRVILMTAYDSPDVQDVTAQLEVDGYLKKPFSTATLRDMATEILISRDSYPTTQKVENLLTE